MDKEYGVITITERNDDTGYSDLHFFAGINTDTNGHITILKTDELFKAMPITPMPFGTIGGYAIESLVEFIQKVSFKGTVVEYKTFNIKI